MSVFVVIGTTTLDLFISGLERLPEGRGDEFTTGNLVFCATPLVLAPGGNGGNSAYVLARLGAPVVLCSAIGRDLPGRILKGWLEEAGVDTRGLAHSATEATSSTTILMDRAMNRQSFHHPGASRTYGIAGVPEGLIERAHVLLLTSYPLLAAWRPEGAAQALAAARRSGAVTALDIGPAIGRPADAAELSPLLPAVDYLICNTHELSACTGASDPDEGARRLIEAGAACVVVKRGQAGVVLYRAAAPAGRPMAVPGFRIEARFTVGAGDAFNAGFLFRLQQGADLEEAARFANAVAASTVSAAQGVRGCPTRAQAEAFLERQPHGRT